MTNFQFDPGSFRDRSSRVFHVDDAIFRVLSKKALKEWQFLMSTTFFKRFMAQGKLIQTEQVDIGGKLDQTIMGEWAATLKHQIIPFISYPYEWSFGMLKDAALLQLELMHAALDEGMILKDSSAFNFQWVGTNPVFIDIPSFEKLDVGKPWVGYQQFCQLFLYPLFLQAYKHIPFQPWLRGSIDGIEPELCNRLMSIRDLVRPGVFMHVYLHAKMQSKYDSSQNNIKETLRSGGFNTDLIKANVRRLSKIIRKLTWKSGKSTSSDYSNNNSHTDGDHDMKVAFVRDVVMTQPWKLVWDLNCDTGTFSRIAAENARYVVAMDVDCNAIEVLYHALKQGGNKSILPLVSNVVDPSPNLGWRGLERKALTERGKPDLTLCLALIHRIVISENVLLKEFIDWIASLGTSIVIEFVTKEDPIVKALLQNKEDNYTDYEINYFEQCLSESFDVARREMMSSENRILYFAKAKESLF